MEPAPATTQPAGLFRAWYGSSVADFLERSPDFILGYLTRKADFTLVPEQRDSGPSSSIVP